LENPIIRLLHSIKEGQNANVRAYHLQILLFFIDRHWSILHDSFQQDVINLLLQFVSVDDGTIQSWTFLCLAAIAHIDGSVDVSAEAQQSSQTLTKGRSRDPSTWDPIWTHSVRRVNVPSICRAACHAAFVLLTHAKKLLTSPRVLLEIETLAKDLDAQGPTFPYDSVCAFLAKCLGVASQDVRLYRIRLEEKVLSWLTDNWRLESGAASKSRMALHTVADVLVLLEAICGLSKRSALVCRVLLPDCPITDAMVEEANSIPIRDFLLKARISSFQKATPGDAVPLSPSPSTEPQAVANGAVGLAEPIGRERKISNFLLKSLESLIQDWESLNNHLMAEKARQAIDRAVIAFAFESLLVLNGTRSHRRVMQAAGRLLMAIVPRLAGSKWTIEERALILLGLEPLTAAGEGDREFQRWEAMLPPNAGTGIKLETLRMLTSTVGNGRAQNEAFRRNFQRIIWQDADVSLL
jgi:ataxia telangiectasia mutated family protein